MVKKNNVYVLDFETNNSDEAISLNETYVWLWDICCIVGYKHQTGLTIDELFKYGFNKKVNSIFYIHNLKFDGSFLLHYLLNNNWVFCDDELIDNGFDCIIDERKVFYRIRFKKEGVIYEFRDSSKKISGKVEDIARSWNLPILKGSIDYKLDRPHGYIPTQEEIDYVKNDTEIIARVISSLYDEGMNKLTSSADSFKDYQKTIGKKNFDRIFPILPIEYDEFIRKSYLGGYCFFNPKHANLILENCVTCDRNSHYPYEMAFQKMPYGFPMMFNGKPKEIKGYDLFITHIKIQCKIKNNCFPSIMKRNYIGLKNDYIEDTENKIIELFVTNVDLDMIYKYYDIYYIKYFETMYFKSSNTLFRNFILKNYEIKSNSTGAKRQTAKIKINSFYGRFALNPNRKKCKPYLNEEGILKIKIVDSIQVDPIYTAVSVFVTAYGRYDLLEKINLNYDNFVYCDTDSITTIDNPVGLDIDSKKIGWWDLEKEWDKFKVIAQKTYLGILKNGKKIVKVCGAPEEIKEKINFENFKFGTSFNGKLMPKQVKGGVLLKETTFTIKDRK